MAEKKSQDFVVVDKRKFTSEGESRPESEVQREPEAAPPSQAAAPPASPPPQQQEPTREEIPEPPTAAEQQAQHDAYNASGKTLNSMLDQAGVRRPEDFEMTFEKLIVSMYMTAMMQLGMIRQEGEAPRADIVGARQTIDTLALLQEKTKGNLTQQEEHMLQNVLFEFRMATVELTNAIARAPMPGSKPPAGSK